MFEIDCYTLNNLAKIINDHCTIRIYPSKNIDGFVIEALLNLNNRILTYGKEITRIELIKSYNLADRLNEFAMEAKEYFDEAANVDN